MSALQWERVGDTQVARVEAYGGGPVGFVRIGQDEGGWFVERSDHKGLWVGSVRRYADEVIAKDVAEGRLSLEAP